MKKRHRRTVIYNPYIDHGTASTERNTMYALVVPIVYGTLYGNGTLRGQNPPIQTTICSGIGTILLAVLLARIIGCGCSSTRHAN